MRMRMTRRNHRAYKAGVDNRDTDRSYGNSITERVVNRLELPKDCVFGDCLLHMVGNHELIIENYRNICLFEDDRIEMTCKHCKLMITGKHLEIAYYLEDEIRIQGRITAIEFIGNMR